MRDGNEIPEMPYRCSNPECPCQVEPGVDDLGLSIEFGTQATLIHNEDGFLVDVFRASPGEDFVDLVRRVHEHYPFARS